MPEDITTRELVAAALRDDGDAARALVRELYPLVAKIVRAHRPTRTADEDLCQMIFIKMFDKLPQFAGTVPIEHWVSRIAVNTCLNALAAEKARPEIRRADLNEEQAAVIDALAATTNEVRADSQLAARELVDQLLGQLPPIDRLIIDMLHLQQKSVAEIAALTGSTRSMIKVRAFRARQKLRARLVRLQKEEDERRT